MIIDWVSRLQGGSVDLTLDLPTPPHARRTPTVGGSKTAAAGVPASYVVRRDRVLAVTFRVWEEEIADFEALIEWGQASEIITWTPDVDTGTAYEVWLESPKAGETFDPPRDEEVPALYLCTVEFRKVDATPWALRYFPTVGIDNG